MGSTRCDEEIYLGWLVEEKQGGGNPNLIVVIG